jgi:hypothetical protein
MKYFTPELYIDLQNTRSDEDMDAADAAWEKAAEKYSRHLDRLFGSLPKGLRQLLDTYYLHDARVLCLGQRGQNFHVALRLDTPPHELLFLHYRLTRNAVVRRQVLPQQYSTEAPDWMYDEVGASRTGGFTQNILLSNGWEICLTFQDVKVLAVDSCLPETNGTLIPSPAQERV